MHEGGLHHVGFGQLFLPLGCFYLLVYCLLVRYLILQELLL